MTISVRKLNDENTSRTVKLCDMKYGTVGLIHNEEDYILRLDNNRFIYLNGSGIVCTIPFSDDREVVLCPDNTELVLTVNLED